MLRAAPILLAALPALAACLGKPGATPARLDCVAAFELARPHLPPAMTIDPASIDGTRTGNDLSCRADAGRMGIVLEARQRCTGSQAERNACIHLRRITAASGQTYLDL